jgi:NADH:ubiquinone oxidoreductase subunit 6 (subunit J)
LPPRRRALAAALLSALVCPGFGQWKNEERWKGALLIAVSLALVIWIALRFAVIALTSVPSDLMPWEIERTTTIAQGLVHDHIGEFSGLIVVLVVVWLGSIVDAWIVGSRLEGR